MDINGGTQSRSLAYWKKHGSLYMAGGAFVYLAAYTFEVLSSANKNAQVFGQMVEWAVWGIFLADTVIAYFIAKTWKKFLRENWLELLALVVPFFRLLRVLRVLVVVRGLKSLTNDRLRLTGLSIAFLLPLVWFVGGISVLDAEGQVANATITTLPQALWWSLATITTVGYGDLYPVTIAGRVCAAMLMVSGITLFSACAGMFATWILRERKIDEE